MSCIQSNRVRTIDQTSLEDFMRPNRPQHTAHWMMNNGYIDSMCVSVCALKRLSVSPYNTLNYFTGNRYILPSICVPFFHGRLVNFTRMWFNVKNNRKKFILRAHQLIIIELWLCIVSILCSRSIPNHLLIHTNHVPVKKEPRKKEEIPCWLTIDASHEKFNTPIWPFILPPEYNWKTSFNWCK